MINFRKISAVLTCAVMLGSTMGIAAAASYPTPFVSNGSANVAVVYGADSPASIDLVPSTNIQSDLNTYVTSGSGGSTTVVGGDSVEFSKSSTKFHLGMGILDVVATSVTDDSPGNGMPSLLADGVYTDTNNDEFDYTQKIDVSNHSLTMWEDDDYKRDEPVLGLKISNNNWVLNYTLDFTDEPDWSDVDTTTINIMGKEYFILTHASSLNNTVTMLDSAQTATLSEGESTTLTVDGKTHTISLDIVSSTPEAQFTIDGQKTNLLATSETQKVGDTYLGVKTIVSQNYQGGLKTAEFSLGSGKLKLTDGSEIEMNDVAVSGLKAYFDNDAQWSQLGIEWTADDDLFVATDSSPTMPGFEAVKLSFGGMYYPAEESVMLDASSDTTVQLNDFPLKDSVEDIAILYGNSTNYVGVGKDSDELLRTSFNTTLQFDGEVDSYFVVSYNNGNDAESYLMRATSFGLKTGSSTVNKTTVQYRKDNAWVDVKADAEESNVVSIGNVEFTIDQIDKTNKTMDITATGASVVFDELYSAEGMKVQLPYTITNTTTQSPNFVISSLGAADSATAANCALVSTALNAAYPGMVPATIIGTNSTGEGNITCTYPSTMTMIFNEEDLNENIGAGSNVTATLGFNSATTPEVSITGVSGGGATSTEIQSTDVFRNFVYSALATEILWDKSGDQYKLDLTYHGGESYGQVYLLSPEATVSGDGTTVGNVVIVKDSEVTSVSTKNLIVVGGSCINSVAANLLGGAMCTAAWESETGIGAGEYLIQSFDNPYASGSQIALLVAGYEAGDTVNAQKALTSNAVDTTVGKKYTGTTSSDMTEAA